MIIKKGVIYEEDAYGKGENMGKSRAALRTVDILEHIAKEKQGVTLSDIAMKLDMPVTSASDILKALLDKGMIEIIDERSKVYGIGVMAYYIGNAFLSNTNLIDKAKPIIEELGNELNKTVFLGKEVNDEITYIYKYEPRASIVSTCPIGSRTSLHATALGKCIMAYDEDVRERIKNKSLIKKTRFTITDHDSLMDELVKVRDRGYAVDDREQNEMLLCIGAPVFDHSGAIIAALSISGVYSEDTNVHEQGNLIKDKALQISRRMGYSF